jgi:DNA polymerase elongation subunit (family B)
LQTLIYTDSLWTRNKYNKPSVILFGRDYNDRTKTCKTVIEDSTPYFYAPGDTPAGDKRTQYGEYSVKTRLYTDALGRQVRKVTTDLPSTVPKIRDYFEFTDEADILYDKRYIIDNEIIYAYTIGKDGRPKPTDVIAPLEPRVIWFDIEVKGEKGVFPDPLKPKYPIVSIQCMDSYTKEIVIFTFGVPKVASDQVACNTEQELLFRFARHIRDIDPDVLSGWYSNYFDIPYIIQRAEWLDIQLLDLSRTDYSPTVKKGNNNSWFIRMHGRQCFDLLDAFKKYYAPMGQLSAYDLKSVISNKDVMEDAAFRYDDYGDKIVDLFEQEDWDTFLQYCRYDVIALDTIDVKLKLIGFYEHLRMIAGVKLEETLMNSRVIESLIMRAGIKPMPTKSYDTITEGFEGATVLSPPIGIHESVGVVDLAALYPNIMVGFNISPDIDGIIPNTMKVIMEEREKLRELKKAGKADAVMKNKEVVLKFLANSFYGVIGWPRFRLYNKAHAAKVTEYGRMLNAYLCDIARDKGYEPIYGDTDSIFVKGIVSMDDGLNFEHYCNDRLAEWSKEHGSVVNFTLKFEKLYRRIMFKRSVSGEAAKKRYAGHLIWKDGYSSDKLDYTGIELKRSDQAEITKDLLREFLEDVLLHDNEDKAISTVRRITKDILSGRISIHDVSIPKGIKSMEKENPWVRGVNNCKELFNINISHGVKPRLIYIKGTHKELCINNDMDEEMILSVVDVDWKKCCDKTVVKKMKTFVESIGYDWNEQMHGQRTLF